MQREMAKRKSEKRSVSIYTMSGRIISTIPVSPPCVSMCIHVYSGREGREGLGCGWGWEGLSWCCFVCVQWEGGRVMGLGWTSTENLVVVLEDGSMAVYNIHGQLLYNRIITRVSTDEMITTFGFTIIISEYLCLIEGLVQTLLWEILWLIKFPRQQCYNYYEDSSPIDLSPWEVNFVLIKGSEGPQSLRVQVFSYSGRERWFCRHVQQVPVLCNWWFGQGKGWPQVQEDGRPASQ